jgi:hypothetical protein
LNENLRHRRPPTHPDTRDALDMFVFKLRAWCFEPRILPISLDLHAEEPPVAVKEGALFPRSLVFPIAVSVRRLDLPPVNAPPPSPVAGTSDEDPDQDCCRQLPRRRIYSQSFARAPAHTRLEQAGPGTSSGGPMDALALSCPSVAELVAPGSRIGSCAGFRSG